MNNIKTIPAQSTVKLLSPGSIAAPTYTAEEKTTLREKIKRLLKEKNAVLVIEKSRTHSIHPLAAHLQEICLIANLPKTSRGMHENSRARFNGLLSFFIS